MSLYSPPRDAAGPVGGCFPVKSVVVVVVVVVVSTGSSKPYEPSTTISLSDEGRVGVCTEGVLPTL